eukprot:Clim_evm8s195 gene=Clim_evmTU8s195
MPKEKQAGSAARNKEALTMSMQAMHIAEPQNSGRANLSASQDQLSSEYLRTKNEIFGRLKISNGGEPHVFPKVLNRWLSNEDLCLYLIVAQRHPEWMSDTVAHQPPSGTAVLYDRSQVKFRKDGHNWKKRKDSRNVREDHMKLKVNGIEFIYGSYAHHEEWQNFHRRCYWLLHEPNIVLVHYLNEPQQTKPVRDVYELYAGASTPTMESILSSDNPPPIHIKGQNHRATDFDIPTHGRDPLASASHNSHEDMSIPPGNLPAPIDMLHPSPAIERFFSFDASGAADFGQLNAASHVESQSSHTSRTEQSQTSDDLKDITLNPLDIEGSLAGILLDPHDRAQQSEQELNVQMEDMLMETSISDVGTLNFLFDKPPQEVRESKLTYAPNWAFNDVTQKVLVVGDFGLQKGEEIRVRVNDIEVLGDAVNASTLRFWTVPFKHGGDYLYTFYRRNGQHIAHVTMEIHEHDWLARTWLSKHPKEHMMCLGARIAAIMKNMGVFGNRGLHLRGKEPMYTIVQQFFDLYERIPHTWSDMVYAKRLLELSKMNFIMLCAAIGEPEIFKLAVALGQQLPDNPECRQDFDMLHRDVHGCNTLHWAFAINNADILQIIANIVGTNAPVVLKSKNRFGLEVQHCNFNVANTGRVTAMPSFPVQLEVTLTAASSFLENQRRPMEEGEQGDQVMDDHQRAAAIRAAEFLVRTFKGTGGHSIRRGSKPESRHIRTGSHGSRIQRPNSQRGMKPKQRMRQASDF